MNTTQSDSANTETPKPIRPPRKTEMSLRVNFTEKELLEIGKRLAEANRQHADAENEKKAVTSTLKARCDSIMSRVIQHSGELTNGYTYRNVPCEIRFDCPSKGQKMTVRLDTGDVVQTDAMTLAEMQMDLLKEGEQPGGATIGINGRIEKNPAPRHAVSGDGVVVTEADGDVNKDEDDSKID